MMTQTRTGLPASAGSHHGAWPLLLLVLLFPFQALPSGSTARDLQDAVLRIKQGKLDAAEATLKKAQLQDPGNVAIYRLLGFVYQRRDEFVQAEQTLEKAVALSGTKDPQLLFLLCRTKFALSKRSEALQLADEISALAEDNPIAHYSLGQLLLANGNSDRAVAELEKAHSLAAENPAITTELIIACLKARREQQAQGILTGFFQHASYSDLVQAGARFGDAGQFGAAERSFRTAAHANPAGYDAWFNLGFAYYRQGNMQLALASLNETPSPIAERQWDYHYLRGKIRAGLHQDRAAEAEMAKALQLEPGNESLCSDAGLLFFRFEDFWKALDVYRRCAAHLPDSSPVRTGLGLTYFRLGKYEAAIASFRKVLASRPEMDAAREALGFLLYIQGNLAEAHGILQQRAKALDADFYISYLDALVLLRLHPAGGHPSALQLLDEALRKNPRFAPAYFERARICEDRNQPERALADLQRATETDSHYAQPYYLIAQVDYKLGRKEQARQAQLRFGVLNREREQKQEERQVEDQLLQSLR